MANVDGNSATAAMDGGAEITNGSSRASGRANRVRKEGVTATILGAEGGAGKHDTHGSPGRDAVVGGTLRQPELRRTGRPPGANLESEVCSPEQARLDRASVAAEIGAQLRGGIAPARVRHRTPHLSPIHS